MNGFKLSFDLTPLGPLDEFASLATQEYNLGREKQWGKTWYVDPESGEKKSAWNGSLEFVGEMIETD